MASSHPADTLAQGVGGEDKELQARLAAALGGSYLHGFPGLNHSPAQASSNRSPSQSLPQSSTQIDPTIGPPGQQQQQQQQQQGQQQDVMSTSAGDSGDENGLGGKGGKRELSQSKRAAQNRAAQRAFRQRKEGYIKKLESQVRDLHALEDNYKAIQTENYSLREYIIHLQSRLIESQGEFPQPPANIDLSQPPPQPFPLSSIGVRDTVPPNVTVAASHDGSSTAAVEAALRRPLAAGSGAVVEGEASLEARAMSQLQAARRQQEEEDSTEELQMQLREAGNANV